MAEIVLILKNKCARCTVIWPKLQKVRLDINACKYCFFLTFWGEKYVNLATWDIYLQCTMLFMLLDCLRRSCRCSLCVDVGGVFFFIFLTWFPNTGRRMRIHSLHYSKVVAVRKFCLCLMVCWSVNCCCMMEMLEKDEYSCRITSEVGLLLTDWCRELSMVNMYYRSL